MVVAVVAVVEVVEALERAAAEKVVVAEKVVAEKVVAEKVVVEKVVVVVVVLGEKAETALAAWVQGEPVPVSDQASGWAPAPGASRVEGGRALAPARRPGPRRRRHRTPRRTAPGSLRQPTAGRGGAPGAGRREVRRQPCSQPTPTQPARVRLARPGYRCECIEL
ncbi:MAG: hypothetical protein JNL30_02235 [Rubrivivax sp.]|nr:hypothetical protein [Rubrivivax sp.]